jgi:hypothetical protein
LRTFACSQKPLSAVRHRCGHEEDMI